MDEKVVLPGNLFRTENLVNLLNELLPVRTAVLKIVAKSLYRSLFHVKLPNL